MIVFYVMHKKKKNTKYILNRTTSYLKCYYAPKSHQSLPKEQLRQNGILLFGINCERIIRWFQYLSGFCCILTSWKEYITWCRKSMKIWRNMMIYIIRSYKKSIWCEISVLYMPNWYAVNWILLLLVSKYVQQKSLFYIYEYMHSIRSFML